MYSQFPASVTRTPPDGSALADWERPAEYTEGPGSPPFIKGLIGVRSALLFLRRNARRIATLTIAIFVLGFLVAVLLPAKYMATALVLADPREQKVTQEQEVLPGIGQDSAALQSLIEIATSDGFLRPIVEDLKVTQDGEIANGETDVSRIVDNFRKRLEVTRRGLTYVIAISFTSRDPRTAARYANAVADAFVKNQGQAHVGATVEAAGFLSGRLKTLREALQASEDAVAAFRVKHNMIDAGKESTARQVRITDLTQQVSALRLRVSEAKARIEQAQRGLNSNIDVATTSRADLLGLLRAQKAQLTDQIAQKRVVLGERHPDMQIAKGQLADIDRQIEAERKRVISTAQSEYTALTTQLAALEQRLKSAESETLANDEASVKLKELQREADANRNIYEQFLARYKTTSEQQLFRPTQVQVVSPATVPTKPTRMGLLFIAGILALGSIILAACIAAVAELFDQRVRTPAQVEDGLGLPVWSLIPDQMLLRKATKSDASITIHDDVVPLLQNIFRFSDGSCQVVLVTAMDDGVGKSDVARTLCELANSRGIPSVMLDLTGGSGRAARGRTVPYYAVNTDIETVEQFLDAPETAPLLGLGDLQNDFGLVVVDAPTLSSRRDVAALAGGCDLTVIVAGWEKTTLGSIRAAQSLLAGGGDASAVAVINGVDPERYALFDPDAADVFARQAA